MKCDVSKCKAWCCKQIIVATDGEITGDSKKHLEYHGVKVLKDRLVIPLRCKYLTKNNRCAIYKSKSRPEICRTYHCKAIK